MSGRRRQPTMREVPRRRAALVNDSSLPASSVKLTRTLMTLPLSDAWSV